MTLSNPTNSQQLPVAQSFSFAPRRCRSINRSRERFFLVLLTLTLLCLPLNTQAQQATKRVLILSGSDPNRPGFALLTRSIQSTLRDGSQSRVELLYELQQGLINNAESETADQELITYLKQKYADKKIDLVLALVAARFRILAQKDPSLFANIPKVFYDFDSEREATNRALGPNITGVWGSVDRHRTTLDLALALNPEARKVVVISGASEQNKLTMEQAQADFRSYENRAEFSYISGESIEEVKRQLAALDKRSIVIFASYSSDRAGNNYTSPEALSMMAPASAAPIYGSSETLLGLGITGGKLLDFEATGQRIGEMSLRVLAGEKPERIPQETAPSTMVVDWRELQRWGFGEGRLPPGTVVRFKQPSFWEAYKWYAINLVGAVIIEALLIAWLLFLRARRRQAEEESLRLARLAKAQHQRLDEIVSNVPGIVWETVIDPDTNERKTTFVSEYVRKMLGYTPAEWLEGGPRFGLQLIPEEDRERVLRESEAVIASGKEGVSHFRWRAKNGKLVWTESYLSPMNDESGKVVGLRGVTIDISERKWAEEGMRRAEERDRAILNAIPDLMFVQTRDGVYLDYHATEATDLLAPPETFLGKNMREVLPPELAGQFAHCFENAAKTEETQILEYKLGVNGSTRWFEARMVLSGDNIVSVVRDITQRVSSEAAIKRSEAQLAGIIGTAMDAIVTVDQSQRIMLFNEAAENMFGCSQTEAIGESFEQFVPERFRVFLRQREFGARDVIQGPAGMLGDLFGLRRSGEEFPMEASISQIDLGGQEFYTIILRDITERKAAEEALRMERELLNVVVRDVPASICLIRGSDLRLQVVNPAYQAIAPGKEMVGKTLDEIWAETGRDLAAICLQVLLTGEPYEVTDELNTIRRSPDGPLESAYFSWALHRVRLPGGEGWGLLNAAWETTQRKQAEVALSEREQLLRAMFGSLSSHVVVLDSAGVITYANRHWNDFALANEGNVSSVSVGANYLDACQRAVDGEDVVAGLALDGIKAVLSRILPSFRFEYACDAPDESRWFQMQVDPMPPEHGGIVVVHTNITDRKQAEQALRQSEERFGKAFRANPQPMSVTNVADGRYIDVNESFLSMSGYAREEVIGHTSLELSIWETPDSRSNFIQQLEEEGAVVNVETKFRTKNGALRLLLSSAERFELGGVECLLVASSDITERMAAQQAVQESEARFRNMADTAPVMIWVTAADKLCTYVNQQWCTFTGRTMEQQLGYGWADSVHPDDRSQCLETYLSAFERREPFRMEYRVRRADGEVRWVIDSATPRFSSAGEFLGYIGSCMDITERKESEESLRLAHAEVSRLKNQLQEENIYLQEEIRLQQNFDEIIGESDALKYVLFKIEQVAPADTTVLITGETGTGKELVAGAIHKASNRADRPLVRVNCAALTPSLIESELFGHEKGSFTGALSRKLGRFELANGATLFLDEIGELPPELQVKLLRVIQEGEFERLGSSTTLKVDVRIIAATNRNLDLEVKKGTFREDLWYRLNVFPITVPPLRQRREDIPLLVEHFVRKFAKKMGKEITSVSPITLKILRDYSWRGNVRELANVIERAVINAKGSVLRIGEDAPLQTAEQASGATKTLEETERDYIVRILEDRGWRIEGPHGAARLLGLNPSTLRTRMLKLGIHRQSFSTVAR